MEWQKAQKLIEEKIKIDVDINTNKSTYRIVKSISEEGFVVPIGKGKNDTICISWKMLEKCFLPIASGKEYNGSYFKDCFPMQAKNHPCHIHTVGQIFVKAGVAKQTDKKTYVGK